jgi:hypothetical protein
MSTPRELHRIREDLVRRQAEGRLDLAGLALEMARRDAFNHVLLESRARALVAIEREVAEIDETIGLQPVVADVAELAELAEPVAVVDPSRCAVCASTLATEANFCPFCGIARGGQ